MAAIFPKLSASAVDWILREDGNSAHTFAGDETRAAVPGPGSINVHQDAGDTFAFRFAGGEIQASDTIASWLYCGPYSNEYGRAVLFGGVRFKVADQDFGFGLVPSASFSDNKYLTHAGEFSEPYADFSSDIATIEADEIDRMRLTRWYTVYDGGGSPRHQSSPADYIHTHALYTAPAITDRIDLIFVLLAEGWILYTRPGNEAYFTLKRYRADRPFSYFYASMRGGGSYLEMDALRVGDLPAPLNTRAAWEIGDISGAIQTGQTIATDSTFYFSFIPRSLPASGNFIFIAFCKQDANNHYGWKLTDAGYLQLIETVAGADNILAQTLIAAGKRYHVVFSESEILFTGETGIVYYQGSRSYFTSETGVEIESDGGALADSVAAFDYQPASTMQSWLQRVAEGQ